MAAHFSIKAQAALEIYEGSRRQCGEVGQAARLGQHVKIKVLRIKLDDGETTSVDRDAIAQGDGLGQRSVVAPAQVALQPNDAQRGVHEVRTKTQRVSFEAAR